MPEPLQPPSSPAAALQHLAPARSLQWGRGVLGTWCLLGPGPWCKLSGQGGPQHPAEPCPPHVLLSLQDRRTARSCRGAGKRGPRVLLPSPAVALCHRPAPPASSACNEGFPWQPYLSVASDTDVNFKMKYSDHSATSINKPQCTANSPST